ncbi:MAG: rRNA maturation RNase YbeY [Pseudomonadota bacterium]
MQKTIVKLSDWRIPRQFIDVWCKDLVKLLSKSTKHRIARYEITLVFVDKKKIRELNRDFRKKDKVTDILSFSGMHDRDLGELILCGERIDEQAVDHNLSRRQELGYLLIHGVLHLLGYDHEPGGAAEKEMFALQDRLFEKLSQRHF